MCRMYLHKSPFRLKKRAGKSCGKIEVESLDRISLVPEFLVFVDDLQCIAHAPLSLHWFYEGLLDAGFTAR